MRAPRDADRMYDFSPFTGEPCGKDFSDTHHGVFFIDSLHAVFPASAKEEHLVHVPQKERTADPSRTATTNWVLDGVVHLEAKGTSKKAVRVMRFFLVRHTDDDIEHLSVERAMVSGCLREDLMGDTAQMSAAFTWQEDVVSYCSGWACNVLIPEVLKVFLEPRIEA